MKNKFLISLFMLSTFAVSSYSYYDNQPADVVTGQVDFTKNLINQSLPSPSSSTIRKAYDVAISTDNKLIVADTSNNRVLIYNSIPESSNTGADVVIGQTNFSSAELNQGQGAGNPQGNTLYSPYGVFVSSTNALYIADYDNHRVLVYNSIPTSNNAYADFVIGQPDLETNSSGTTANKLNNPTGIFIDNKRLYIADTKNNRVLIYNTIPSTHNPTADIAIGQPNLNSGGINQSYGTTQASSDTLYWPNYVTSDGTRTVVSDYANHRVLVYNSYISAHNTTADVVIGQSDFYSRGNNQGGSANANTMYYPAGVFYDSSKNQLFVAEYYNNRVLIFNGIPTQITNSAADLVLGQPNFSSTGNNQGNSAPSSNTLYTPKGIFVKNGKLYVADANNHRVLIHNDAFKINSISPDNGNTSGSTGVTISGVNFLSGSSVKLTKSGESDITAQNIAIAPTTITCTFDLRNKQTGYWDVIVTSGSISYTLSNGFEVKSFSISSITPDFGYNFTNTRVYIKGSNFTEGSTIKLTNSADTDIDGTNISISTGLIKCNFDLWDKTLGLWNIVITTGNITETFSEMFLLTELAPSYKLIPQASGAVDSGGGTITVSVQNSKIYNMKVIVPSGAISSSLVVSITININNDPPKFNSDSARYGSVIDIWPSNLEFTTPVTISIPYTDSDLASFGIDDPNLLDIYTYNESLLKWENIGKTSVDTVNKLISAEVNHFSLYALGVETVANVNNSYIFPNPFKPSLHSEITFSIPSGSIVDVYNIAGELVRTLRDNDNSGRIAWDAKNSSGNNLASGVYICVIKSGSNKTNKKLAIIR